MPSAKPTVRMVRSMRTATGHPAVRSTVSANSFRVRCPPKNWPISDLEKRNCSVVTTTAEPSRTTLCQIQSRIRAKRQDELETAGTASQQALEQIDRCGREPFEFVQHEQAGSRVGLDRANEHPDLVRERRCGPGVLAVPQRQIQARVLERERKMGSEQAWRVVLVHREPGDEHTLLLRAANDFGERGRLAEPTRRPEHRNPPIRRRIELPQQCRPMEVPLRRFGRRHLGCQKPRGSGYRRYRRRRRSGFGHPMSQHAVKTVPGVCTRPVLSDCSLM